MKHIASVHKIENSSIDKNGPRKLFLYHLLQGLSFTCHHPSEIKLSTTKDPYSDWCGLPAKLSELHGILFLAINKNYFLN